MFMTMNRNNLAEEILRLKRERNILILAHYYQRPEIQDLADFVGDSLALARFGVKSDAPEIILCGVTFMAETVKILCPEKTVWIPDPEAGCSLSDTCPADTFRAFRERHPEHTVVTYINSSAEVKALSDIICTSSNAEAVIRSIPQDRPILFAPDQNLGRYLQRQTGREMLLWPGHCAVHQAFALEKLGALLMAHPAAKLIAHPECDPAVVRHAAFVGSTQKLLQYVTEDPAESFIVATEVGILHRMREAAPHKELIPAPVEEETSCACSECAYMKRNTLIKLHNCFTGGGTLIELDEELRRKASAPLRRMMEISETPV